MKKLRSESEKELLKKALSNIMKKKEYHAAPPTKKQKMLMKEYTRIREREKKRADRRT